MGLFSKVKDILFEEEEVTEAIPKVKEEPVAKRIERPLPKEDTNKDIIEENKKSIIKDLEEEKPIEIDMYKKDDIFSDNTFPFQDFDEEEFSNSFPKDVQSNNVSRAQRPKNTNVLDYERKKKEEKREYSRFERVENTKENDKKKFKPSPIISPVYGILDKDYHPEDISSREDGDLKRNNKLDLDKVRKKAFDVSSSKEGPVHKQGLVHKEEVKEEKREIKEKELKKSVDELLAESAEETTIIDENLNVENNIKEIEDELDRIDDELILDDKPKKKEEDDTLEQDLFELIDSMYEDKKEDDE